MEGVQLIVVPVVLCVTFTAIVLESAPEWASSPGYVAAIVCGPSVPPAGT